MKRLTFLLLTLALALGLTACGGTGTQSIPQDDISSGECILLPGDESDAAFATDGSYLEAGPDLEDSSYVEDGVVLEQYEYYYDLECVVLYLDTYGELPSNYITKDEARDLGWEGGSVEAYLEGAAIGGDRFGNREGLLPKAKGRSYTECDLYTNFRDSRGAERLVFSNDGLYFYTGDHYETFTEVWVEDGEVVW